MSELWYVAQLKPSSLRVAEQNLLRQGFEVFAPKIRRTCRRKGRFRDELQPLFPGYILVKSRPHASEWRAIGSTLGVRRIVSFGEDEPPALPADVVSLLQQRCGESGICDHAAHKEGDLVRLISGPFSDLIGRVEVLPALDRIYLLLDFMGEQRRVSVPVQQVLYHPAE